MPTRRSWSVSRSGWRGWVVKLKLLSPVRQGALANWAVIGVFVLLCGAWVLPSNKLYHQHIILFLWLPALLALFHRNFRALLVQPEVVLFGVFSLWTLFVLFTQGGGDPVSKAKLPFYVVLTLFGVVLAAFSARVRFEAQLRVAVLFGGGFAILSIIDFYLIGQRASGRLIAIGLWDKTIMAAHAVGALAVIGVFLFGPGWRKTWLLALLVVTAFGYAAFLGFSQTRGVWVALGATLVVMVIALPTRKGFLAVLLMVLFVAGVALLNSEILLQRGVSYRPPLWSGGLRLMLDNWLWGFGFNQYEILVPATGMSFKHPHNFFLDTGVRLGVPGLLLFCLLWGATAIRGWQNRSEPLGRALLALWMFSSVSLMTDGIGLWLKPNADWLITWLPISLAMVLASRQIAGMAKPREWKTEL